MKTFLIILYLGNSVGVMGPLDWSLDACRARIEDRAWLTLAVTRIGYRIDGVTLDCVRAYRKPAIGEQR
jgi:hypothetical protein